MKKERINWKEYWKEKGYTDEQIENHYSYKQIQAKQLRERRKQNNEKNKEIIAKIKSDVLNKTFKFKYVTVKVLAINPTVDGIGFYYKIFKTFRDGSKGEFRYFSRFDEYNKKDFVNNLKY